jgi:DNA polymerase III psi subunit
VSEDRPFSSGAADAIRRDMLNSLAASRSLAQAIEPIRVNAAPAETARHTRQLVELNGTMIEALQNLHAQQVADTELAQVERDAAAKAARRDFMVNVTTLVITALSLVIAIAALIIAV